MKLFSLNSSADVFTSLFVSLYQQLLHKVTLYDLKMTLKECIRSNILSPSSPLISIDYQFQIHESSALVTHDLIPLGNQIIRIATQEKYLISITDLMTIITDRMPLALHYPRTPSSCLFPDVSQFLRDLDGEVPEICSIERKKFLSDLLRSEKAIQDISRVLSEDFHRSDLPPQPQLSKKAPVQDSLTPPSNRQRSFSYAEGEPRTSSGSSPHDRYSGVWGGMDLHSTSSLYSTPTKSCQEHPEKFPEEEGEKQRKVYTLSSTGIDPKHLKSAGYNAEELRLNGFTAPQLIGAGNRSISPFVSEPCLYLLSRVHFG
jgi:hypothetical protein